MANRLGVLWTLTYGEHQSTPGGGSPEPVDRDQVKRDVQRFFKLLRAEVGRLPYLWVIEWGSEGGRLHVHIALGRRVPHRVLWRLWGHGFVQFEQLGTKGSALRRAARYLAKYVTKVYESGDGQHGYEVAQGYQPKAVEVRGRTEADVMRTLVVSMAAGEPEHVWRSADAAEWRGPPCGWMGWADAGP